MNVKQKRITESELMDLLADLEVTDDELAPYFVVNQEYSDALMPVVQPNPDLVESEEFESAFFLNHFNNIARWRRNKKYKKRIRNWNGLRVVAEGDSWFQYPFILKDVVDHLTDLKHFKYAIYGLSEAGDLLKNIVREDEVSEAVEREDPHILLISGGGNDMVGGSRIKDMVHKFTQSRKPENYPNSKFDEFLDELERLYRQMFSRLLRVKPQLKIFCHGYDFSIPADGKWLGKPLKKAKIEDEVLQRKIVAEMITRFNQRLIHVVQDYPGGVFHIDCRSLVDPSTQWHDELHPTNAGYFQVAKKFDMVIQQAMSQESPVSSVCVPFSKLDNIKKSIGTIKNVKKLKNSEFLNLVFKRALKNKVINFEKPPTSDFERKQLEKDIERHFEKIHLGADFLPSSFLEKGVERAQAVCRIVTNDSYGSGSLIATRDFIMTNNHVIESPEQARLSKAQFDYDEDETLYEVLLDPDRFFVTSEELDFTIVACKSSILPNTIKPVPLLRDPATVTRNERVNIIQHPQGRRKEVSLHDNKVIYVYDKVIRYTADTEGGSSGSPVFNNQWDLVALHHAGQSDTGGRASNEGVRMTAIVEYLLREQDDESYNELEILLGAINSAEAGMPTTFYPANRKSASVLKTAQGSKNLTLNIEGNLDELTVRIK